MGRREMGPQRKSVAALISLGFLAALVLTLVFEKTFASNDERVVRDENMNTSTLKNPLPMSKEMALQLQRKEIELKEQEKINKEAQERLAVEESRVQKKIDELIALQAQQKKFEIEKKKMQEEIKQKLVKTFEKMAPKKAAPIISNLEDSVAVEILLSMKEKTGASILESMDPARATSLSGLIAERGPAASSSKEGQSLP